jgi:hypothetical protein
MISSKKSFDYRRKKVYSAGRLFFWGTLPVTQTRLLSQPLAYAPIINTLSIEYWFALTIQQPRPLLFGACAANLSASVSWILVQ